MRKRSHKKGGGKGGKPGKGPGFGVFMLSCASMLGSAQSLLCQPCNQSCISHVSEHVDQAANVFVLSQQPLQDMPVFDYEHDLKAVPETVSKLDQEFIEYLFGENVLEAGNTVSAGCKQDLQTGNTVLAGCQQDLSIPKQIWSMPLAFHAYDLNEIVFRDDMYFAGLEP